MVPVAPTAPQLAAFTKVTDPDGDRKKYFLDGFKERRQAMLKLHTTYMVDREKAYRLLRSLCTAELNALLATNAVFAAVVTNDPLGLFRCFVLFGIVSALWGTARFAPSFCS